SCLFQQSGFQNTRVFIIESAQAASDARGPVCRGFRLVLRKRELRPYDIVERRNRQFRRQPDERLDLEPNDKWIVLLVKNRAFVNERCAQYLQQAKPSRYLAHVANEAITWLHALGVFLMRTPESANGFVRPTKGFVGLW